MFCPDSTIHLVMLAKSTIFITYVKWLKKEGIFASKPSWLVFVFFNQNFIVVLSKFNYLFTNVIPLLFCPDFTIYLAKLADFTIFITYKKQIERENIFVEQY